MEQSVAADAVVAVPSRLRRRGGGPESATLSRQGHHPRPHTVKLHPIPVVLSPPPPNLTCKPKSTSQAHNPAFPLTRPQTPAAGPRPPISHGGPASAREAAPDGGAPVPHAHAPAGSPTPSPNGAPFREVEELVRPESLGRCPSSSVRFGAS